MIKRSFRKERKRTICPNERQPPCPNENGGCEKCLQKLERVKGIEPSYSAWKAAALPLSYTRARPINYHAMAAASTAMHRPSKPPWFLACFVRNGPLTGVDSLPILRFPPTTKGGDPVSYTKRCHLAGIAR